MSNDSIWTDASNAKNQANYIQATSSGSVERPGRWVVENGTRFYYKGPGLVTSDEKIMRTSNGQVITGYDLNVDPGTYLTSLTPSQRVIQMRLLANAGFIDPRAIGDWNSELSALEQAMQMANFAGLEWSNAVNQRIAAGPVVQSGGQTRTYRTTSPDDLKKIGNKIAQSTLGREFTADEAAKFVQAYQQQEIASQKGAYSGGTVQQAPALDVAAETFAQQIAPQEAAGYKYLGYINKLFGSIGVQ